MSDYDSKKWSGLKGGARGGQKGAEGGCERLERTTPVSNPVGHHKIELQISS